MWAIYFIVERWVFIVIHLPMFSQGLSMFWIQLIRTLSFWILSAATLKPVTPMKTLSVFLMEWLKMYINDLWWPENALYYTLPLKKYWTFNLVIFDNQYFRWWAKFFLVTGIGTILVLWIGQPLVPILFFTCNSIHTCKNYCHYLTWQANIW